jgi:GT2 family glycosyltransferase
VTSAAPSDIAVVIRLGVVVVTHNSNAVVDESLAALSSAIDHARATTPLEAHLVVVDNASEPPLPAPDGAKLVSLPTNVGFAPAVNVAIAQLRNYDYVLLLNPDARLQVEALSRMLTAARERSAGAVGPMLVDDSGAPNGVSERPFHTVRREAARQLLGVSLSPAAGRRALASGNARCLTGACLLVSHRLLDEIGWRIDDALPMYLEDVELCASAHDKGIPVVLVPDARCIHALGGSSEGANFATSRSLHVLLLAARHEFVRRRSPARALAMRILITIGAAGRFAVGWLTRRRTLTERSRAAIRWALHPGATALWPPEPPGDRPSRAFRPK